MTAYRKSNDLINESSIYLLQHAYNPVDWKAWNEQVLTMALEKDKPLLISIGYAACHWCHVMERESFENSEIADYLNEHFTCIKVDREERADVDLIYMNAIQKITGRGGWPLNMFALPDGRPFHGGTYFKPADFLRVLKAVKKEFDSNRQGLVSFAQGLNDELIKNDEVFEKTNPEINYGKILKTAVRNWKLNFDIAWGGDNHTPKFPLPVNINFLMAYAAVFNDNEVLDHVENTLANMARGGIFDQLGGGFARYSTDRYWKVPHFEKMLYDNTQLLFTYAGAAVAYHDNEFAETAIKTLRWVSTDLKDDNDLFYSALDADSDGTEGAYYIWKLSEIKAICGKDAEFAMAYFNMNNLGIWEDDRYILLRDRSDAELIKEYGLTAEEFGAQKESITKKLLNARKQRVKPVTDTKTLTAWNALAIIAFAEASWRLKKPDLLQLSELASDALINDRLLENTLLRSKTKQAAINGFLDDYALSSLAFYHLFKITAQKKYLQISTKICSIMMDKFYDKREYKFYYTEAHDNKAYRPVEQYDTVIPSSTSVACTVLFHLGQVNGTASWAGISTKLLSSRLPWIEKACGSFANWALLALSHYLGDIQIVICGNDAREWYEKLGAYYFPAIEIYHTTQMSDLEIFKDRWVEGETMGYVCRHQTCGLPISDFNDLVNEIKLIYDSKYVQ